MRKDEAAKLLPIIKAFSEGKEVQYKANGRWYLAEDIAFFGGGQEFRIKPEPKYRPFKDAKECWQEMLKHQPFGWITNTDIERSKMIDTFDSSEDDNDRPIRINESWWKLAQVFEKFTFTDGTPFGIKVEE
nr:MAG TPA: hypothetical protein [Bacteriophage sp.]